MNYLACLVTVDSPPPVPVAEIREYVARIGVTWENMTGAEKRQLLLIVAPRIVVTGGEICEVRVTSPLWEGEIVRSNRWVRRKDWVECPNKEAGSVL